MRASTFALSVPISACLLALTCLALVLASPLPSGQVPDSWESLVDESDHHNFFSQGHVPNLQQDHPLTYQSHQAFPYGYHTSPQDHQLFGRGHPLLHEGHPLLSQGYSLVSQPAQHEGVSNDFQQLDMQHQTLQLPTMNNYSGYDYYSIPPQYANEQHVEYYPQMPSYAEVVEQPAIHQVRPPQQSHTVLSYASTADTHPTSQSYKTSSGDEVNSRMRHPREGGRASESSARRQPRYDGPRRQYRPERNPVREYDTKAEERSQRAAESIRRMRSDNTQQRAEFTPRFTTNIYDAFADSSEVQEEESGSENHEESSSETNYEQSSSGAPERYAGQRFRGGKQRSRSRQGAKKANKGGPQQLTPQQAKRKHEEELQYLAKEIEEARKEAEKLALTEQHATQPARNPELEKKIRGVCRVKEERETKFWEGSFRAPMNPLEMSFPKGDKDKLSYRATHLAYMDIRTNPKGLYQSTTDNSEPEEVKVLLRKRLQIFEASVGIKEDVEVDICKKATDVMRKKLNKLKGTNVFVQDKIQKLTQYGVTDALYKVMIQKGLIDPQPGENLEEVEGLDGDMQEGESSNRNVQSRSEVDQ